MKPVNARDLPEDAEPAGMHKVVIVPPSNSKALVKGVVATLVSWGSFLFAFLLAAWFEPSIAALVKDALQDHPEWTVYYTLLNLFFYALKNRVAHNSPESRSVIVGKG